jgi:hypothetical protein
MSFDPLNRAKKIAEQATQAASDAKENATARAADLREKAASRAEEAVGVASGVRDQASVRLSGFREAVAGKLADVKEATIAGVKDIVDDFNEHLPALREAGYTLTDVAVELGLPPKVIASFGSAPDISQERIDAVVEEHKEARGTVTLLRALYTANKLQNSVRIAGMSPRGIVLELGLTPSMVVKFA